MQRGSMSWQRVRLDNDGRVARLVLTNPQRRNAVDVQFTEELTMAVEFPPVQGGCKSGGDQQPVAGHGAPVAGHDLRQASLRFRHVRPPGGTE